MRILKLGTLHANLRAEQNAEHKPTGGNTIYYKWLRISRRKVAFATSPTYTQLNKNGITGFCSLDLWQGRN